MVPNNLGFKECKEHQEIFLMSFFNFLCNFNIQQTLIHCKFVPHYRIMNFKHTNVFFVTVGEMSNFLIFYSAARFSCIRCQDPIPNQNERFQCLECSEDYSFDYCKNCNEASKHKHSRVKVYPSCTP
jgi:hypothetical protein